MAEVDGITGKTGLDTTDFKNGLSDLNRSLRVLNSEFKASAAELGDWSKSATGLESRIQFLNRAMDLQRQKITNLQAQYDAQVEKYGANSAGAQELAVKVNNATAELNKMGREVRENSDALDAMQKNTDEAAKETNDLAKSQDKAAKSSNTLKSALSGLGGLASGIAGGIASATRAVLGLVAAVALMAGAIAGATVGPASALNETLSKSNVVFGELADGVVANARRAADTLGVSQQKYLDYASSIGAALRAGGLGIGEATALSEQAIKHFADLASFHNAEVGDVAQAWQSAIRGQYEPIQKFFPFITNEYLITYGTANGLVKKNTTELDANQRAIILNAIALDSQLNPAMNDFAETSGGWANQVRELTNQLDNIRASAGQALLTVLLPALTQLNNLLSAFSGGDKLGALTQLQDIFGSELGSALFDVVDLITRLFGAFESGNPDRIAGVFEDVGGVLNNLVTALLDQAATLGPQLINVGLQILQFLAGALIQNLPVIISTALTILQTLLTGIIAALPSMIPAAVAILTGLAQFIVQNLPLIVEAALTLLIQLATAISEQLPTLIPAIVEMMIQIVDTLVANLPLLVQAATQLILGLATGLVAAIPILIPYIPQLVTAIFNAIVAALPIIGDAAVEVINTLLAGLQQNEGLILASAINLLKAFTDGMMSMYNSIRETGIQMVNGLWDGFKNRIAWFKDNVIKNFKEVLAAIKNLLGIKSPSQVFDEIGEMMGRGLEIGADKSIARAVETMKRGIGTMINLGGAPVGQAAPQVNRTGNTYQFYVNGGADEYTFERMVSRLEAGA
jgi:hypothetical protein